jgi:hypothetical protein
MDLQCVAMNQTNMGDNLTYAYQQLSVSWYGKLLSRNYVFQQKKVL